MKIVIDGRMYYESGIGRYIRNLLHHLQIIDTKNDYSILLTKKSYDIVILKKNFKKVLADFGWYGVTEQIRLLGLLRSLKSDLVHFPHFNIPLLYKGKFVVTIHDLIHQHFSMERVTTHGSVIYKIKQAGYKIIFKNALFKSAKILVPSQFVKDQLIRDWQVNTEKIVITPEAVDDEILNLTQNPKRKNQNVLRKFNIKQPYIFYAGNAHPHKNIEGLIKAFLVLRKNQSLKLVLTGHDHYFWQKIKNEFQHKDIIYTGWVSDAQLVTLYKNAKCFVLPSFEEGFGLPILEAMACECPVVCSNIEALKEIGGSAAIYFNPYDRTDMISKTNRVLRSEKLRRDLKRLGSKRVKLFNWGRLAKKTQEVYEQCGQL